MANKLRLRAAATILAGLLAWLGTAATTVAQIAPENAGAAIQPADGDIQPEPSPPSSLPRLDTVPETTVIGAPAGVGAPGGITPASTQVNSANLTPTELGNTGSSVTVITAEQIQQRRQFTVTEMLRGLPGVDVVQAGGPGQVTSVFIRGASAEQTKVILDGIWMNDPITTGRLFDFSTLQVDNIERIEIIRGPQSLLYGSDAIGGVINIVTKKGAGKTRSSASFQGGSFGTSREGGSVSGGTDLINYSVAGSYWQNTGFSAADSHMPGNVEPDGYRNANISGRYGWTPAKNFDVDFFIRYMRSDIQTDDGGGPFEDDPNARSRTDQLFMRGQMRYVTIDDVWEQRLSYNFTNQTREFFDVVTPVAPNSINDLSHQNSQTNMVDWRHLINVHETNKLTFGAMYYVEQGTYFDNAPDFGPPTALPLQMITDPAVYVQDQVTIADRWVTTFGVRQDNYSNSGVATTYRANTLYRVPVTNTGIRGSFGSGFKAPTVFQTFTNTTFDINSGLNVGSLAPEQSVGYDYGIDQPFFDGKVVASVTYFSNSFTNLIQFVSAATPPFFGYYANVARAHSSGLEVTGLVNINDVTSFTAMYTKLQTVDETTGLPLLRRPGDRASLGINRKVLNKRGNLNMSVIYVGTRDDVYFPPPFYSQTTVMLPSYIIVNVAGSYDITPRVQVFGRIDNLTNTVYEEAYGFGTAPVSAYAGLGFNW
ncbi:MAG TPA: TonB-dependent receptor [Pirellulales bacterium]|jgi:vitamin B12 transporter|nr:TonB-dependent receptor [Pirellulales bacterium]